MTDCSLIIEYLLNSKTNSVPCNFTKLFKKQPADKCRRLSKVISKLRQLKLLKKNIFPQIYHTHVTQLKQLKKLDGPSQNTKVNEYQFINKLLHCHLALLITQITITSAIYFIRSSHLVLLTKLTDPLSQTPSHRPPLTGPSYPSPLTYPISQTASCKPLSQAPLTCQSHRTPLTDSSYRPL